MLVALTPACQQRLDCATDVALAAGRVLLDWFGRLDGYDKKGDVDLVSAADRASEALIVERLTYAFPNDTVVAEEGSASAGQSGWAWVVDPLDGTTNFVHGFPIFMVAIGLTHDGQRVAGVCHAPMSAETFVAARGRGATRNGRPIHVSPTTALAESLLATGFPYDRRAQLEALLRPVSRTLALAHDIRRTGSAAYDQCLVACGRLDGFFERGLKPWDTCAASLLVEEAGGRTSTWEGGAFDPSAASIVASNGCIHAALLTDIVGAS